MVGTKSSSRLDNHNPVAMQPYCTKQQQQQRYHFLRCWTVLTFVHCRRGMVYSLVWFRGGGGYSVFPFLVVVMVVLFPLSLLVEEWEEKRKQKTHKCMPQMHASRNNQQLNHRQQFHTPGGTTAKIGTQQFQTKSNIARGGWRVTTHPNQVAASPFFWQIRIRKKYRTKSKKVFRVHPRRFERYASNTVLDLRKVSLVLAF